jgi:hypothetical protein
MGNASAARAPTYGQNPAWGAERPRTGLLRLLISWVVATLALCLCRLCRTCHRPNPVLNVLLGALLLRERLESLA